MRYLLIVLMMLAFITIGCDKNTTESNNNSDDIMEHSTINVKTATEYFNFNINSGSVDAATAYDIIFYSVMESPAPGAPQISFPRFRAKDDLSIAVIKETILENITEIPANNEFTLNYSTENDDWFHMTDANIVLSNESVWVVNTTDGKFPAFEIINYYDEQGNSGVFTINWKYLSE